MNIIRSLTSSIAIIVALCGPTVASNLVPATNDAKAATDNHDANSHGKNDVGNSPKQNASNGSAKKKASGKNGHALDLSGTWNYDSNGYGWIALKQTGTQIKGTWHDVTRHDDNTFVTGQVSGNTVVLRRYNIWGDVNNKVDFTLSVLNKGNQMFGYGDGFFANHLQINMARDTKK